MHAFISRLHIVRRLLIRRLHIRRLQVADRDNLDGVPSDDIGYIVRQQHLMSVVECEDANGNTPLSEASGGGSVEAITFLVEQGPLLRCF